jgi:hypothetical protein
MNNNMKRVLMGKTTFNGDLLLEKPRVISLLQPAAD